MPTTSQLAVPAAAPSLSAAESVGVSVPRHGCGAVHSVFRRACNIEMASGALLTLLDLELGAMPSGIRCAPPGADFLQRLRQGQTATIADAVLHIPDAQLSVDFGEAPVWHGDPVALDVRNDRAMLALHSLRAALNRYMPMDGFAPLLWEGNVARTPLERSIAARLEETLPALARAIRVRDANGTITAVSRLVGVGIGLTPSGDDFVVGVLAALWSRAGGEPGLRALLCDLASPFALLASRTNTISRQQLLDAVRGRFSQRLVELLHALARGGDVSARVRYAVASGHSSGADTLSGLSFGLSPWESPPCRPHLRKSLASVGLAARPAN